MGRKKKKKEVTIKSRETSITVGTVLGVLAISMIVTPFFDAVIFTYISRYFGLISVGWGIALLHIAAKMISQNRICKSIRTPIGIALLSLATNILFIFTIPPSDFQATIIPPDLSESGGELGYVLHIYLENIFGRLIEFIILIILYISGFSLATGLRIEEIIDFLKNIFASSTEILDNTQSQLPKSSKKTLTKEDEELLKEFEEPEISESDTDLEEIKNKEGLFSKLTRKKEKETDIESAEEEIGSEEIDDFEISDNSKSADKQHKTENDDDENTSTTVNEPRFPNWKLPPLSLLKDPIIRPQNNEILKKNASIIEETLESFNVRAKVKKITIGPTVAQYALSISTGTKVSKIRNLANDLALALAAPASTIRIEAPIPGTSLIGIEIPNPTPNFVFEKEMAAQLESVINKYELPLILGKSVSGDHIIKDLTELPHCLVAGATGTGKSVGINSILIGLLMTKTPDQLKLILVDPKMVEMSPYNGIPHLLTPVITDMELVVNALQWSIEEMLRRYRMLKQMGVRKLSEYNKKIGFDAMPYIVIVIDEMADLMLSTGIDVESKIVRLAQMSRAVGIHLVLATQRPSVDVITGLIKANVPGRISFSVATSIDSRVIIDQPGSEALIGKGDLLFKSPELPKPLRIQGAYTDIKDIEKVIDFIKAQVDEEDITYFDEVTEPAEEETSKEDSKFERDELFEDALELVINAQKASASYLQRKLRIGYNRAARLIDELHEAGAVGPSEGSSPRKVTALSKSEIMNKISSDGEIEDDGSDNLDEYMDEYDKDIE